MTFKITEPLVRKLLATVDVGLSRGLGEPIPGKMCVEAAISYALGEPHSDGPSCVDPIVRQAKITLNDAAWSSEQARAKGMRRVAIAQLGSKGTINATRFVTLLAEYTIRELVPVALRAAALLNPSHAQALEGRAVQCERDGDKAAADAAYAAAKAADAAANAAYAAAYAAYAAAKAADAAANAADAAAYAAYAAKAAANASYAAYAAYAAKAAANAAYAANAANAERDRNLSLSASLMVRALHECGSPGCEWLWLVDETEKEGA